jgi:DNA-binding NarL/FixJ family response regulator
VTGPAAGSITRVVIAEDSLLVRQGIVHVLEDAGFTVVGEAGEVEELLELVETTAPDVAIVDIRMPPTHTDEGIQALAAIRERHGSALGVLVLSHHTEPAFALRLLEEGAAGTGYLLKDSVADVDDLADAVRRVARGGSVVDPAVVAPLVARRASKPDRLGELTEREREVLTLMAEGRSNQAIADRLFVTGKTVEAHIASIFSKLDLLPAPDDHRRVLAVLAFLEG